MILDLEAFIKTEKPFWEELESQVHRLESDPLAALDLTAARRLHYLYERISADLVRLSTFAFDPATKRHIESLVARSYALVHDQRQQGHRFAPRHWFFRTLPRTFRAHWRAFLTASLAVLLGAVFGAGTLSADRSLRQVIMPFPHLHQHPSARVAAEESRQPDNAPPERRATFSSLLMTHNTRVAIFCMGLGITFGFGTLVLLFYNGVILGAVTADYLLAGEMRFLLGWLLPHGIIEIPAFIMAGQAGLVLAHTLIGRGAGVPLGQRLRDKSNQLVTLICGVAILLMWAGIVEAYLSQTHAPVLSYNLKIGLGLVQGGLLAAFLIGSGRRAGSDPREAPAR